MKLREFRQQLVISRASSLADKVDIAVIHFARHFVVASASV